MNDFDFIVVGAGVAGCALASRLAERLAKFDVLLIDAGGHNEDPNQQSFGERHWTLTVPGYNWGYKSVPQQELNQRDIDCSRGKGLGGSTAINLGVYTRGASADYDHWAELVEDDIWSWENVSKRFDKIEKRHPPAEHIAEFASVHTGADSMNGPVDVEVPEALDPSFGDFMKNSYHYYPKNLDHNSGNPVGISVCQLTTHNQQRVSASGAYLLTKPANLTIVCESKVTKVLLQDRKAIGVETSGEKFQANREIILSAGAIDSPKILLLSGIGPSSELEEMHIPVIHDLPGISKNL